MSDRDAYPSEMTNPFGPTDDELDGVYAGVAPADDLEEVAAFMVEVKTTCVEAPREEVAGRHLAAMLDQARQTEGARPLVQEEVVVTDRTRWRRVMDRTISTVLKGAAGVLAASMSMMGLAYAGVDLPGQAAANALEAVTGVELPNQAENENDKSVAEDVKAIVEESELEGCEFGQAVAAAASQNAQGDGAGSEDACTEGDEEGSGGPRGSKATGDARSAEGRAKAAESSGGASDTGNDNATTGADRATSGADNATSGKSTATERSSGGGTDHADDDAADDTDDDSDDAADGQGTAAERSGGASDAGSDRRP